MKPVSRRFISTPATVEVTGFVMSPPGGVKTPCVRLRMIRDKESNYTEYLLVGEEVLKIADMMHEKFSEAHKSIASTDRKDLQ